MPNFRLIPHLLGNLGFVGMSVLMIRANKRFAVCRKASLARAEGAEAKCMLIEVSLDGCRVGNIDGRTFRAGEQVRIDVPGAQPFSGEVRWQGDSAIGLKLSCPFHIPELDHLIRLCRGELDSPAQMRA